MNKINIEVSWFKSQDQLNSIMIQFVASGVRWNRPYSVQYSDRWRIWTVPSFWSAVPTISWCSRHHADKVKMCCLAADPVDTTSELLSRVHCQLSADNTWSHVSVDDSTALSPGAEPWCQELWLRARIGRTCGKCMRGPCRRLRSSARWTWLRSSTTRSRSPLS